MNVIIKVIIFPDEFRGHVERGGVQVRGGVLESSSCSISSAIFWSSGEKAPRLKLIWVLLSSFVCFGFVRTSSRSNVPTLMLGVRGRIRCQIVPGKQLSGQVRS